MVNELKLEILLVTGLVIQITLANDYAEFVADMKRAREFVLLEDLTSGLSICGSHIVTFKKVN